MPWEGCEVSSSAPSGVLCPSARAPLNPSAFARAPGTDPLTQELPRAPAALPVALKLCWAFQWLQFPEPCPAVCQGDPCSQLGLPQKAPRPPWPCLCGIWAVERGCIQHLPWLEGTNPCEEGTRGDTFPFMGVWNLGLPGTEGTL